MAFFLTNGIWLLMLVGACVVSWFLREFKGARRLLRIITTEENRARSVRMRESRSLTVVEPVELSEMNPENDQPGDKTRVERCDRAPLDEFAVSQSHTTEASALKGLQSLAELRREANAIRTKSRLWDDPDVDLELRSTTRLAQPILDNFGRSVDALQKSNENGKSEERAQFAASQNFSAVEASLPSDMASTPDRSGIEVRKSRSTGASL